MRRRDFCKTVPCAALAATYPGFLNGTNLEAKAITAVQTKVIKGTCDLHKIGDVAEFKESGVKGKICIHALYSMMPAVFAMLFNAQFPWLENPDTKTHACPDAFNPVVFEITRIRKE
ncbi:MAG: TIGR04076 family protein [Candidatus Aminicenantes bacterium]|nr:MAG: TIGR04076 family protein [Candidatus Aminicenantes bacterium]